MKKNVAGQFASGEMISSTDGSDFTGAVTCYITGDNGTQTLGSVGSGACTHKGNGLHTYAPSQAETNYNHIVFTFKGAGAVTASPQVYTSFPQTVDNATALTNIQSRIPAALVSGRIDAGVSLMATGVISAGAISSGALDGKGDWNIGKSGYTISQPFPANFSALSISGGGLVDITQAAADKAWATSARVLTAGTNIALAKGTGITGFNDLSTGNVATAVWDAATATYGSAGSYGLLVETNLDAKVSTAGGTSLTEAGIADAVWDELLSGHAIGGSAGAALTGAGSAGDPWSAPLPGAYGSGTAGKIIGDNINATISSRSTQTSVDAVKGDTAATLIDTAEIGAAGAGLTALSTQASVTAIYGLLDTEMPALTSAVASIQADTDNIQTRLPAALTGAGNMKADVIAISGSTKAADNLEAHAERSLIVTFSGGTTTTAILDTVDGAPASSTNDVYNGRPLIFGAPASLKDQGCSITDYDGATKTATISAVTAAVTGLAAAVMS